MKATEIKAILIIATFVLLFDFIVKKRPSKH